MAHPFYTPEDEVGFEPQSKRDVLPLSHSARVSSQQEIVDRTTGAITPIPEGEKSRNSTRRRIPVACNRCRKRKIKCSGDNGDGQGCSNCRNSGNLPCQFLRVNSSMLQTKASGWPYTLPNLALSPAHQRQGTYVPTMAPKQEVLSANPSSYRVSSLLRPSAFEISPTTESQPSYSRPLFGQDHMVNYEDESSTVYSSQPQTYMVPTTGVTADYYGIPWSKTCHSGLNVGRGPNGGLLPEHEAESTFQHPNYAYVVSGPGAQSPDPNFVPSMVSLSSEGQGTDRTLPSPSGRGQLPMGLSVFPTSSEAISGTLLPDCRIGRPWAPKGITENPQSMKQYTPGSLKTSLLSRARLPASDTQEMMFGYVPTISASTSSPLIPSSGIFTRPNLGNSGEELQGNEEAQARRPMASGSSRYAFMEDSPEIYGYSSSEKKRKGPKSDSSAMLMNGLPYTRPPEQLQSSPLAFSFPVADGLPDGTTPEAHRTQALGNPGGLYSEAC
ncbi:hypothetical protein BDV28DRAFT_136207 [Aspergillus coremiiformis]|uniref:Zn(2)-C6 fungal-type domain-containing protein n=1 Tax=Aspergillus coremiiformis TaxID=138285 RepID=A0A5N6Z2J5_9EURO|nr:hypothetical protein BDV28DRAFT_136207 [Aspergillus coremiiformis]